MTEKRKRMENQKRKQVQVNGCGGEGRRTKAREDNGEKTATEAEVDEFFAILKQLHSAVKQFRKDNGGDINKLMGDGDDDEKNHNNIIKGSSWKPAFESEDFEEIRGGIDNKDNRRVVVEEEEDQIQNNNKKKEAEGVEENLLGFDLNAEPESDSKSL